MTARVRLAAVALAAGLLAATASVAGAQAILLVHLPSAPVEAANKQAEAITSLAEYLSQQLAGQPVEAKIFRRWRDANVFLAESSDSVELMLSDASFALAAPADLSPAYRFVRRGVETYRRQLVVLSERRELEKLADLSQKRVAIVETAGEGDLEFLQREVFEGDLDPATWFADLEPTLDDFLATASVLYGQTDAALIAEYNPLLASHLGKELRVIFDSPALSLPVLSLRSSAFDPARRQALARAIADLPSDPLGQRVLGDLGIEGLRPLAGGGAVLRLATKREKRLEIALPTGGEFAPAAPALPGPQELSYGIAVELPEIPLNTER